MQLKSIIIISLSVSCARALSSLNRRYFLVQSGVTSVFSAAVSSAAVIQKPICEQGQGEGCAELADSDFLRDLQAKSSAKRAERDKAALERYNYNNFGDYFAAGFPPRRLVRHADGRFDALTDAEVEEGIKAGKIGRGNYGTGWNNYQGRNPLFFIED